MYEVSSASARDIAGKQALYPGRLRHFQRLNIKSGWRLDRPHDPKFSDVECSSQGSLQRRRATPPGLRLSLRTIEKLDRT